MANYGFYYDAENCIGCRTCQVACKDAHDLPVGTFYRKVTSYVTGGGWTPGMYHLSLPLEGYDFCAEIEGGDGRPACVESCLQRVLEFGDIDELRARHAGEELDGKIAPLENGRPAAPSSYLFPAFPKNITASNTTLLGPAKVTHLRFTIKPFESP